MAGVVASVQWSLLITEASGMAPLSNLSLANAWLCPYLRARWPFRLAADLLL